MCQLEYNLRSVRLSSRGKVFPMIEFVDLMDYGQRPQEFLIDRAKVGAGGRVFGCIDLEDRLFALLPRPCVLDLTFSLAFPRFGGASRCSLSHKFEGVDQWSHF